MELAHELYSVLEKCPLFSGMDGETAQSAIARMEGKLRTCKKGEMLYRPWERHRFFGLVLAGSVHACQDDPEGNRMILAQVQPGVTFGESLCYLQTEDSPVYVYAAVDSLVLLLNPDFLRDDDPLARELCRRFIAMLACRTLSMNDRIQILSRKTIREKLLVYFYRISDCGARSSFRIPLNREDLAAYIGADRSSLSRELSAMKREGILDVRKDRITLHKKISI